ncbi:hypothetical protein TVAG_142470 [Trichomonas vaginalis G3]|uniref:Sorting nexin/Vps5-like C-terminal domain-containing protein n=1 Tax=Trichomonas vaginalis (strain ATCC PRA-98 / G3) TaxID=412133 RepID=A2EHK6_TRIV3|nr:BAR/IMD domain-like family [Trichomonas vaginalis G3]EAY07893.1 hypothetical protein TVAG_142470 [Trichomonas vaginalis G3]KAI5514152.1 BAR/IMD domain-like family [Trichomonas vaginalis G3]|eukprot:XP_001320116.1 hypothetical protein [Trichomonas vaginalis G3]
MKQFFKKSNDRIRIAVDETLEKAGAKKIEEVPDYIERNNTLIFIEQHAKNIQKSLTCFTASLKNLADSQKETANSYSEAFENSEDDLHEMSEQLKNVAGDVENITKEISTQIPQQVIKPLEDLLQEIQRIHQLSAERRKCFILNKNAQNKFVKAQEKGKNTESRGQELVSKKADYDKAHETYIKAVDDLNLRKNDIFSQTFKDSSALIGKVVTQISKNYHDDFPSSPVDTSECNFPPL